MLWIILLLALHTLAGGVSAGHLKSQMAFLFSSTCTKARENTILSFLFLRRQRRGKPRPLTRSELQQAVTMWCMSHNPINVFSGLMWGITARRKRQQRGSDNWESEPSKASKLKKEIGFYPPPDSQKCIYCTTTLKFTNLWNILHRMEETKQLHTVLWTEMYISLNRRFLAWNKYIN